MVARVLRDAGAEIAVTYLNAKAEPFVRPLAEQLESYHIVGWASSRLEDPMERL